MWQDLKMLLIVCGVVGVFNMIKPPFQGFLKSICIGLLSFIMGVLVGLVLTDYVPNELTRCGFGGMGAVFAIQLYEAVEKIIKRKGDTLK